MGQKRYAVITGASRGIGRALALGLAREGYALAVCSRDPERLEALGRDVEAKAPGTPYFARSVDVSQVESLRKFAQSVQQEYPRVDVLINNAGIFLPGDLLEEDEDHLDRMLRTNLFSAYQLTRALAPAMAERQSGSIVNICSVASLQAYPQGGAYSISKHALLGFSRNLRLELKDSGVRVITVLPGAVLTDSWSGVDLPPERFIPVEDLAETVLSALRLSGRSVVEEIVIRPQQGDI